MTKEERQNLELWKLNNRTDAIIEKLKKLKEEVIKSRERTMREYEEALGGLYGSNKQ